MKNFISEKKSLLLAISIMFVVTIFAYVVNNFSHALEEYPLLSTNYGNTLFNLVENQGINTNDVSAINFIKITNKNALNNVNKAYFRSLDNQLIMSWKENNTLYFGTENDTFEVGPNMDFAFWKLENVTSINLSAMNTTNVINMSQMFLAVGKTNEKFTINLGDHFDTSNVTNMASMFEMFGTATNGFTLNLGNKFNTAKVTDMSKMFYGATVGMEKDFDLSLGNHFDTSNVTNMAGMFEYITANTFSLGNKFNTSKVTNMASMFQSGNLNKLILGNSFNTINVKNIHAMFSSFNSKEKFNLGNHFNTSNVTDMSEMFKYVFNYKEMDIDVSLFNIVNVTNINRMFENTGINVIRFGEGWNYSNRLPANGMFINSSIDYAYFAPDAIKNYNWTADQRSAPKFYPTTSIENAIVEIMNTTYNGNIQKPNVSVEIESESLIEDFHYTINYGNFVDAGIGKVTIEGIEKYFGSITKNFTINKRNIILQAEDQESNELINNVNQVYASNLVDGHQLKSIDFTLDENTIIISNAKIVDNNNADVTKNYNITYNSGIFGNYNTLMHNISNQNIVIPNTSFIYTGDFIEPEVYVYDRVGNVDLLPNIEFTVEYKKNQNVGTAEIIIKGTEPYYNGTAVRNFEITKRMITIEPKDQIGTTLDESLEQVNVINLAPNHKLASIDFSLSNSSIIVNNPKIVDSKNNDVTSNYEIMYSIGKLEKKDIGKETINIENNLIYTGKEIKPSVTIAGLKENVDFKVEYSNNINPGLGSIVITGLGEYTGTILRTFMIDLKPITIKAKNQSLLENEEIKKGDNYIEVMGLNIGHKVSVELIKNEDKINLKNVVIKDESQNDVTHYYNITLETGVIKYVDYAIDSEDLYVDNDNREIKGIGIDTNLTKLKELIKGSNIKEYRLTDKNKNIKGGSIVTGDKLKITYSNDEIRMYDLAVSGDVSGDGKIELEDIMKIAKQIYTSSGDLSGIYLTAADYDEDDNITLSDIMKIARKVYLTN